MSKARITVFLCGGRDCSRAWRKVCDGAPRKWLRRRVKDAGLPYKLKVIETECMDRCDDAACVCVVHRERAGFETRVQEAEDADRLLAAMRACVENAHPAG